jgi:hypothetical protein
VAAPGCYPTSILVPLVPLLRDGVVRREHIVANSLSGVSGAGKKAEEAYLYVERAESVKAYGLVKHRHLAEIEEQLALHTGAATVIQFNPHLAPMRRGIATTLTVPAAMGATVESAYCLVERRPMDHRPLCSCCPSGETPDTALRDGHQSDRLVRRARPADRKLRHHLGGRQPLQRRERSGGADHESLVRISRNHRIGLNRPDAGANRSAAVVGVFTHVFVSEIPAVHGGAVWSGSEIDFDLDAAFVRREVDRGGEYAVLAGSAGVEFSPPQMGNKGGFFLRIQTKDAVGKNLDAPDAGTQTGKVEGERLRPDVLANGLNQPADVRVIAGDRRT